jgi:hypothetical protein
MATTTRPPELFEEKGYFLHRRSGFCVPPEAPPSTVTNGVG